MADWTPQELNELDRVAEVQVAGRHADGTSRRMVTVWHVVVDGHLYMRSVKGPQGQWYRGVTRHDEGFLRWDGQTREVAFTRDTAHDAAIDAAYIAKYGRGSATSAIISTVAAQTTVRVDPR